MTQWFKRARAVWLTIALVVATASCDSRDSDTSNGEDVVGSLSVPVAPGMKAVYAPRHVPYYYTHGSFVLCNSGTEGSESPVLEAIEFNTTVPPLAISTVIRSVPPKSQRRGSPFDWSPLGGVLGRPGHFPGFKLRGKLSAEFQGTRISNSCAEREDLSAGFTELLVVMKVGGSGSDVDGFTISYSAAGRSEEVAVPWRMVGCGSEIARKLCE